MKTPEQMAREYAITRELFDPHRITFDSRLWLEQGFLAGYQAATAEIEAYKDGAKDAAKKLKELIAEQDQFADTSKVMDTCEHILHMEKMVDVNSSNNSNGWISVKDRLPSCGVLCAWISDTTQSCIERMEVDDMHPWYEGFDYWCELPEAPKGEK